MDDGVLEWTIQDKPNSRHQKYRRFTSAGVEMARQYRAALREDWLSQVYTW